MAAGLGVVLGLAAITGPASAAPDPAAAQAFIQSLADRATAVVKDKAVPKTERDAKLRSLLLEGFDIRTIGKFALGVYRRGADKGTVDAYLVAFEDYILHTYSKRFGDYAGEKVEVGGTRPAGKSDIFVKSDIVREGKDDIPLLWRVRDRKGSLTIIDVEVEGTSQALTYKQEFASVIQNRGNGVAGLIEELRQKTTNLKNEPAPKEASAQ